MGHPYQSASLYPYIDRTAGLSYEVLAPAIMPSGEILNNLALLANLNQRLTIHAGGLDEEGVVIPTNADAIKERYAEHCKIIDEG